MFLDDSIVFQYGFVILITIIFHIWSNHGYDERLKNDLYDSKYHIGLKDEYYTNVAKHVISTENTQKFHRL